MKSMKTIGFSFLLLVLLSCQLSSAVTITSPPPPTATSEISVPTATATVEISSQPSPLPSATPPPAETRSGNPLNDFETDLERFFTASSISNWQAKPYQGTDISLPIVPAKVSNWSVTSGLTNDQLELLTNNGFVVQQTQETQFLDLRRRISRDYGQPYYLTTDAAYHALHITFDELLKALEKLNLHPQLAAVNFAVLQQVDSYQSTAAGTPIESDARLALAYLSVAQKLLDPTYPVDEKVADLVDQQIAQIMAGEGKAYSVLFPAFQDDYGAYKPVGHYAGDPGLEAYFRAMTWYGRVHFNLKSEDPNFIPSRVPLIITLALRQAVIEDPQISNDPAVIEWSRIHSALSFLIGPTDDSGPVEYAALMDQIYGDQATILDLADEILWQKFIDNSSSLPAPKINSTFVVSLRDLSQEVGWRFLGQRFTMDALIFQNLVSDLVGTQANPRKLPTGLDIMATFGSLPAMQVLEQTGETAYLHYPEQMAMLQEMVSSQSPSDWFSTFYSSWVYSFLPQVSAKDGSYPSYMQTQAWGFKDMNSALGSWAELKHDTALYTKMPEFAGGGGPPGSPPAPGYVEPDPLVFYNLAYAVRSLQNGLISLNMTQTYAPAEEGDFFTADEFVNLIFTGLENFADRLDQLGQVAAKELSSEPISEDDAYAIQDCLGPVECKVEYMQKMHLFGVGPDQDMPPVPVIAAAAGADNDILQVGVGSLDRIYVAVPLESKLQIAQGGVFSYYEFKQPRSDRLSDDQWRDLLNTGKIQPPQWTAAFSLPGGVLVDVLAFRIGDVYLITEAGDKLNMRSNAGTNAAVLTQLHTGDYLTILDGPVENNGYTWWKVSSYMDGQEGWVVENQDWFERGWGQ